MKIKQLEKQINDLKKKNKMSEKLSINIKSEDNTRLIENEFNFKKKEDQVNELKSQIKHIIEEKNSIEENYLQAMTIIKKNQNLIENLENNKENEENKKNKECKEYKENKEYKEFKECKENILDKEKEREILNNNESKYSEIKNMEKKLKDNDLKIAKLEEQKLNLENSQLLEIKALNKNISQINNYNENLKEDILNITLKLNNEILNITNEFNFSQENLKQLKLSLQYEKENNEKLHLQLKNIEKKNYVYSDFKNSPQIKFINNF